MSAAATPLKDQMSALKYELLMAGLYAPLDVTCECDSQEWAYKVEFESILSAEKLNKYDTKEDIQNGVVWSSFEDDVALPEIYQLLLSNSAEDAGKLELMLNIAWWKAARTQAIENCDNGTDHQSEPDFYDEDQPQMLGSRYYSYGRGLGV